MASPAEWENQTPIFGIRYPKPAAPALHLPDMFGHIAADVETALQLAEVPPTQPAPVIVAATAAARDAYWGIPANAAEQLALQNRGATTIRTDLGLTERYFAAQSVSNPGGRPVAGWYPIDQQESVVVWQPIPLASGASTSDGLTPQFCVLNRVVFLRGRALANLGVVGTLPPGARPGRSGERFSTLYGASGTTSGVLILSADGTLSTGAGMTINLNVSFPQEQ